MVKKFEKNKIFSGNQQKIDQVIFEIKKEYNMGEKTLQKLIDFQLQKGKEQISKNSIEYRKALIQKIQDQAKLGQISSFDKKELSCEKYEILANKLIEISKLKQETQVGIQNFRHELLNDLYFEDLFTSKSIFTSRLYSKEILEKIDNPKNIIDNMYGFGVGIIETATIIGKFTYDTIKGFFLTPSHLLQIRRGEASFETNITV